MLFEKRGLTTHDLLHLNVSPYGFQGIAFMQILGLSSLVYLIISSVIVKTDTAIEDAAMNFGASELQIFREITLKRIYPEISTACVLVFLASMSDFETPLIIGGAYQTIASDLYIQITGFYDMKSASVSGIFLLATIPIAVPGILLGIGYLVTFKYPILGIGRVILKNFQPLVLLGSGIIIYIICIFRYLNIGLRVGNALMEHIDPNIEDAARNVGLNEYRIYSDIVFSLIVPAFRTSLFRFFSTTMTTLGAIIFLLLPSNKVVVQSIFQTITSSERDVATSMALMLSLMTLFMLVIFHILSIIIEKLVK